MVSREVTRPLRKLVPAVAIGVSALLGVVGCSAGQVAQTAEMEPAVNGNSGQVGQIMLRDVEVAYPEDGEPYRVGDDAPLVLSIVNVGGDDDRLTGVTSPAGQVEIIGNPSIPGRSSLEVVLPADNPSSSAPETTSEPPSSSQSAGSTEEQSTGSSAPETTSEPPATTTTEEVAPDVVGTISLVITGLTGDLPYGKTVPVTFQFEKAGSITIQLPVASPATPRPADRDAEAGAEAEGH